MFWNQNSGTYAELVFDPCHHPLLQIVLGLTIPRPIILRRLDFSFLLTKIWINLIVFIFNFKVKLEIINPNKQI